MRGNINFILDTIDTNEIVDEILVKFFNMKIKSQNLILKKMQLKTYLLDYSTKKITKKYRGKGEVPLDIVLIECAIDSLKNKTKEEILSYFSTKEGITTPNFYKICTMIYSDSDFVKENLEQISKNIKENKFLFSGICSEILYEKNDTNLDKDIERLNILITNLRDDINQLSRDNQRLDKEIIKLKKESLKNETKIKTYESKISTYKENNQNLEKEIINLKNENREKERENNLLNKEIIKLNKELKENQINLNIDEFECGYRLAFIYQDNFNISKKIFNDVLFIKYEEFTKKYTKFIQTLKKQHINKVIMQSNKISTFDIINLENRLKQENINMNIDTLYDERATIEFITKNL